MNDHDDQDDDDHEDTIKASGIVPGRSNEINIALVLEYISLLF